MGPAFSLTLIALCSLAGALVYPLSNFGANWPARSGPEGLLLLAGPWVLLAAWALLFAGLLRRISALNREKSLFWATACHLPLLLCLALLPAVYGGDASSGGFALSPIGRQLYQLTAKDYVVVAPLGAQLCVAAVVRWRSVLRDSPILAVILIAFALRFSHAAWGLPALLHPDEHRYIGPATIIVARGDLNPYYFQNPSVMIYLTSLLFWLLTDHSIAFHALDQYYNLGIPDPRGDFFQMVVLRGVVALAGTATVVAVYLTGKEFLSRRAALFGAIFLTISFLHVRNSHYATNDILAVSLLAFSFFFACRIYARDRAIDYVLAGALAGLAASTKYNAGIVVIAIVFACVARGIANPQPGRARWRLQRLLFSGLAAVGAFVTGTPYSLLDNRSFVTDFLAQFGYGAELWHGQGAEGSSVAFLAALGNGFGWLPLALAVVGIALGARHERWKTGLLLVTPLAYFLFMSMQRLFFARFDLPVLPFLALLGGYGLERLLTAVSARTSPSPGPGSGSPAGASPCRGTLILPGPGLIWRAIPVVALAFAVAQPLALTLQHDAILGSADTRLLAAAWIDANLPADTSLAMESYAQLDAKFGWKGHGVRDTVVYWPEQPEALDAAISGSYKYVVVSSFGYGPLQGRGDPPSLLPPPYQQLEARGRLIATFGAGPGGVEIAFALDDMYTPYWRLWERERPGPTVRVYQMTRE